MTSIGLKSIRMTVGVGVAAAAVALSCASQPPQPPQRAEMARAVAPPKRKDPPPQPLPGAARALLHGRMVSHARDMGDLVSAIMLLEYPRIHERATAISTEITLARPLTDDATELAASVPASFFDLQDELRERARTLDLAAQEQSAMHVADAYGRLSETCVRCHASFR
jgi:hypothetical protein